MGSDPHSVIMTNGHPNVYFRLLMYPLDVKVLTANKWLSSTLKPDGSRTDTWRGYEFVYPDGNVSHSRPAGQQAIRVRKLTQRQYHRLKWKLKARAKRRLLCRT